MDYLDFELRIAPGTGREYPVSVLRSPGGEASGTMRFPFDTLALQSHLQAVQIALLRSGGPRRDVMSDEQQSITQFGQQLFEALMTDTVRETFRRSQDRARSSGKGLRVQLRIEAPELSSLPWEYLYDPSEHDYLCLSTDTPVVRYLELDRPPEPVTVELPLSILGMIASPSDRVALDVQRERHRVEAATAALRDAGLLKLTWLEGSTWRDLQKAMRQGPFHIFHFVGHGGFDTVSGEGVIALADDAGKTSLLSATQLGRLLADHQSLRLVVLNSCLGAKGSGTDVFSSTASILIRRGVPAVVAMQYEISDQAAVEFARSLYEAIAEGMPVDAAVAEARKGISLSVNNTVEWGTPVLYMRSPDGVLFRIKGKTPSAARASGELPPAKIKSSTPSSQRASGDSGQSRPPPAAPPPRPPRRRFPALVPTLVVVGIGVVAVGAILLKPWKKWMPVPTAILSGSAASGTGHLIRVERGESVTLTWATTNASEARLEPGMGAVHAQGSRSVSPQLDAMYRLVVRGPGGMVVADTVRVAVRQPRLNPVVQGPGGTGVKDTGRVAVPQPRLNPMVQGPGGTGVKDTGRVAVPQPRLNPAVQRPGGTGVKDTGRVAVRQPTPTRLGPVGGNFGQPFSDLCDDVAEVHVREGYFIDAIQLVCRSPNGAAVAKPVRGGPGGTESIFHLQPGERITAVSGSALGSGRNNVYSVLFQTNQRSSPVYGNHGPTGGQLPFRFDIPRGSRFGGLFGQAAQYLSSLGVLVYGPQGVPAQTTSWRLGPVGGTVGEYFTDLCGDVAEVHVREGYFIDAIQLICRGPNGAPIARSVRGGPGGTENIFQLQAGERITAISGSAMGQDAPFVFSIQIQTDRRSSPVYGNHGPTKGQVPFRFDIPSGSRLKGLIGRAGQFLDALGVAISGSP